MSRPYVTAAVVAAAVALVAVLVFLLFPSPTVPPPDGDGPVTGADRAESARQEIAELRERTADEPVDYDEVFARAESFREEGQLADAQLMYFFAARNGHPRAAFRLATMNDPLHHDPSTSLLPEPDAFQAYRWYMQALEGGVSEAADRLDALREWAEEQAGGNPEAEQLLLQWE